jgi:hypothetical protein
VLRWCSDAAIKTDAAKLLCALVGFEYNPEFEQKLITKIAKIVDKDSKKLKMNNWHNSCGTTHCLAGWAAIENEQLRLIEEKYSTEIAGCVALPNYAQYFFETDTEVLKVLKELL